MQGGRLLDADFHPLNPRIGQADPGDFLGHPLDQEKPRILHQIDDILGNRAVVDGIVDMVSAGGGACVDFQ